MALELSAKNDWRREYDRQRWPRRKAQIIEYLGGKCAICGGTGGPFDFDHIDPSTKCFVVSNRPNLAWVKLKAEVDKCQVLCEPCHSAKSIAEHKARYGWKHGTVSGYQHGRCRCAACREAQRAYTRERYRRTSRAKRGEIKAHGVDQDPRYKA
jgi:hypothetical protein